MDTNQNQTQQKFSPLQNTIDTLFRWSVKNRERIIAVYKILYLILVVITITGGHSAYYRNTYFSTFYGIAVWMGKIGLLFYVLTVIPGIARRFGIKHKVASILMIFRRYNGIAMFFGVFSHYVIIRGAQTLRMGMPTVPPPAFELFGLIALIMTALLFFTSNDYSVSRLKKTWNRIHQLTYIIIWLIAFHIILQGVSVWSLLISAAVIVQIASFLFARVKKSTDASSV